MLAFEPLTYAMGMALAEHAIRRPSRVCLHAKLWLRRAPDVLIDNALNEAADPLLDALNSGSSSSSVQVALHGAADDLVFFSFLAVMMMFVTVLRRRQHLV